MHHQRRKACLLLDNCTTHHALDVQLKSMQLRTFLPNATSIIQTLKQEIINSVKCAYKKSICPLLAKRMQAKITGYFTRK